MASAIVALANITLNSPQLTVTFSNIPATGYRDLRLIMAATNTTTATATDPYIRINGDAGTNYNRVKMQGSGTAATSTSASNDSRIYYDAWSTAMPALVNLDFLDFNQIDKHKTILIRGSVADSTLNAMAARWASTAAINSITIYSTDQAGGGSPDSFAIGSTFTLYGVVA